MAKSRKKIDTSILKQTSEVSIEGLFGDQANVPKESSTLVGEAVALSKIRPNRFHARQILPLDIKKRFFSGDIDYIKTTQELIQQALDKPLLNKEIQSLRALGNSMLVDGQINAVTGYWKNKDKKNEVFILETGARRFWAFALLHIEKIINEEPKLQVIESSENTLFREISENYQREELCAVEIGINIASIFLLEADIPPDQNYVNELDYFRKALEHGNRSPEIWDKLEKIFSIPHEKIKGYLNILELSDELLYEAALHRLTEVHIRTVLLLPKFQQEIALFSAIKEMDDEKEPEIVISNAQVESDSDSPVDLDVLAQHIQDWFELANQEYGDGNFKDLAKNLASRLEGPSDLDNLARRLVNLSRDIRVEQTKRRQY